MRVIDWKEKGDQKKEVKELERKWWSEHEIIELKILEEVLVNSYNVQYSTNCTIQLIELKCLLASRRVM